MNTLQELASALKQQDDIWIYTHMNPDGDTLGSAFALLEGLRQLGKRATVVCHNAFPGKFYRFTEPSDLTVSPRYRVSVDVASPQLLGDYEADAQKLDCCIDHHRTNTMEAPLIYVDDTAAATCEIIYELLMLMGISITKRMANSLYTGITTDTGCYKFSNTSPRTHRIAAALMEAGCEYEAINRELFDTKSRGRILVERHVLDTMDFYFDGKLAIAVIPQAVKRASGILPEELDGVSALPRQIEGVEIGITMREREDGCYKISVRTATYANAAEICRQFGGGGHDRAAGATLGSDLAEAKQQLVDCCRPILEELT